MEHLKGPLVCFLLREAIIEQTLLNTLSSCMNYWVMVLKDNEERKKVFRFAEELIKENNKQKETL